MRRFIIVIFILILPVLFSSTAFAADFEYHFMHNDHDMLVIGEITNIDADVVVIRAEYFIVSAESMDPDRKQLVLPVVCVNNSESNNHWLGDKKTGGYVIASLNKEGNNFNVAYGLFAVDSLDYKTLIVDAYGPSLSAEFTDFVNSGGLYTRYGGISGTSYRYHDGVKTVIYDPDDPDVWIDTIREARDNTEPAYIRAEWPKPAVIVGGVYTPIEEKEAENPLANILFVILGLGFIAVLSGTLLVSIKKDKKLNDE